MIKKWLENCRSKDSADLTTRIENKLGHALKKFAPTNNAFIFSVFHNDICIIQIVHRSYVDILRHADNSFGFALNLTFDPMFETEKTYHEKFKKMEVFADFKPYDWEGIHSYAIDLDKDINKTAKIAVEILKDLYDLDEKNKFILELINQGQM